MERHSELKDIHTEAARKLCGVLKKVYGTNQTNWDLRVPMVLWDYRNMCKKLTVRA